MRLGDLRNTVILVDQDEDIIVAVDYIIHIAPKAGRSGGKSHESLFEW